MEKKILTVILVIMCLGFTVSLKSAGADFNSSTNPAPVGEPVRSMVELGSVYSNIYDITVTVLETVRGAKAMDLLKKADPGNKMPPEGFEYVLARVRFEMRARAVSDRQTFDLGDDPLQWVALSSDLMEYKQISVTPPDPKLIGRVHPGDSMEGWVAFAVDRKDKKPLMIFDPDSGGATGRGRTLFFNLY